MIIVKYESDLCTYKHYFLRSLSFIIIITEIYFPLFIGTVDKNIIAAPKIEIEQKGIT